MKKKALIIIAVLILIIIVGGVYYWTMPKTKGDVSSAEVEAVLSKLGAHMILPSGEVPQVGRIDDPVGAAKAQPFVSGSVEGDLLIIYAKAAKAIVYSPSRDIIVNVGPVSMNPEASSDPAEVSATSTEEGSN